MVISCVAYGCQNRQDERPKSEVSIDRIPISFHRFPANKDLREQWIKSVKRWKWTPTRYSFICSDHFLMSDYKVPPWEETPRLHKKVIPSIYNKFPGYLKQKSVLFLENIFWNDGCALPPFPFSSFVRNDKFAFTISFANALFFIQMCCNSCQLCN